MEKNQMFVLRLWDEAMAGVTYMNTYGKRQRLLRNDLGLTQIQLAELVTAQGVEVGQGYISELERTDKVPLGTVVAAVAKALHTSTDFLLQVTDEHAPRNGNGDIYYSQAAGEAAAIIDDLDEETREVVLLNLRLMKMRDEERRDLHQEVAALIVSGINQFDENQRKLAQAILAKIARKTPPSDTDDHHT